MVLTVGHHSSVGGFPSRLDEERFEEWELKVQVLASIFFGTFPT